MRETKQELKAWKEKHQSMVKRKNDKYNASRDRITFLVEKGRKEEIQAAAAAVGASVSDFCARAVLEATENALKDVLKDS